MARGRVMTGADPFLRLQREAWPEHSREVAEQTAHPAPQLVCPGDLPGLSSFFLKGPLGKLETEEDLLLSMDGGS